MEFFVRLFARNIWQRLFFPEICVGLPSPEAKVLEPGPRHVSISHLSMSHMVSRTVAHRHDLARDYATEKIVYRRLQVGTVKMK